MSPLLQALLDGVGTVGAVLDTPGAMLRGALAGDGEAALGGVFDPEKRLSGRDLLERWGLLGSNQEGFDAGDALGFGAEMLLDPLNLATGGGLAALRGVNKGIDAANAGSKAMRAAGAMPEEIAALTKLRDINVPESLNAAEATAAGPLKMYHGTPRAGIDAQKLDPRFVGSNADEGFYGSGVYFSDDPNYANAYTALRRGTPDNPYPGPSGSIVQAFIDSRKPYVHDHDPVEFLQEIEKLSGQQIIDPTIPLGRQEGLSEKATDILRSMGYDSAVKGSEVAGVVPYAREAAVFDKNQIYSPYIAPALQDNKPYSSLLAALLANNGLQTAGGY